jgi:hypothetical protein
MTRDAYERLVLDGYVDGLDAPDDDIGRALELDAAELWPGEADAGEQDEFPDDEIMSHVELAFAA